MDYWTVLLMDGMRWLCEHPLWCRGLTFPHLCELQGRRWAELQPYFERVWTMTLRCLDDIKETVRR